MHLRTIHAQITYLSWARRGKPKVSLDSGNLYKRQGHKISSVCKFSAVRCPLSAVRRPASGVRLLSNKNQSLNSSFIIDHRKLILIPIDCKFCPACRGGVKNAMLSVGTRLGGGNLFCINDTRPTDGFTTVTLSICFIYCVVNMVINLFYIHVLSIIFLMEYPINCWK